MKIGLIGIGGIGGFVGAYLANTYSGKGEHTITFIQRGEHGKKIAENGLQLLAKNPISCAPDFIYSHIQNAGIFDVIIISTKSKDLEDTIENIKHHIYKNTTIITLLNGVNNATRIQEILPNHRVLNGCIYVSAAIKEPGVIIQQGGAGQIFIGPDNGILQDSDFEIETVLKNAGLKVTLSNTISTEIWRKYLFISPFATMTTRYNLRIGEVVRKPELLIEMKQLLQEIVELGKCFGAELTQKDMDSVIELALKIPETTPTSMQLDVYSGKLPEIDVFAEFVVKQAAEMRVSVPLHSKLLPEIYTIIKTQMHA